MGEAAIADDPAGGAVHAGRVRLGEPRRTARAGALVVLLAAAALGAGCGGSEAGPGDTRSRSESTPDLAEADLWLSFDVLGESHDGTLEYRDANGAPHVGTVVTANGAEVASVEGQEGRGRALALPPRCDAATGCPRVMVEVAADPSLDPEDADFSFGASVRLAADQTAVGSNLVQKGRFGTTGGQWKLQVDGDEGQPTCVVRSGQDVVTVRASVPIADDRWHLVVCRRDSDEVSIEVDGSVVGSQSAATGSVSSAWPIRVGSPGVGDGDDQFHGVIDDVFLEIASGG